MEKYYSFSWYNRGNRENWFPVLPCRVWIGMNGAGATVNIDTAGELTFDLTNSKVKVDEKFEQISKNVITSLISDTNIGRKKCLNLNNGSVANAWYEMGFGLQKLGDGWALFSRMD